MTRDGGRPGRTALNRRALLRVVGGGSALATGLAGCSSLLQDSYQFTADPVVHGGDTAEAGFTETTRETVTAERTESVAGNEVEVIVNSQVSIYASERDTEPLDGSGLWEADGGTLAVWTGGNAAGGARASELVDGDSLVAQSDGLGLDRIPAAAAQVWAPNTAVGALRPEDLLIAYPEPDAWTPTATERDAFEYDGAEIFPSRTALDLENALYVAGREEDV